MQWAKANGGPLAIVLVGLALVGFTTAYAWAIVVVGVVWWLWETQRHRIPLNVSVGKGPSIVTLGLSDYWRTAKDSPEKPDLQVVYARVRNDQDGGGERTTARNVRAWMEARSEVGDLVSQVRGIWLNIDARMPDPRDNSATIDLPPIRHEVGLEIAAKFVDSDLGYLAGELEPPSLEPGKYTVSAAIGDGVQRAKVFEWTVENPGRGKPLEVSGVTHPAHRLRSSRDRTFAGVEAGSATGNPPLVITTALYGVADNEADVSERLTELIDQSGVLDFEVTLEYLLIDPAPEQLKTLRLRWSEHGRGKASAFREGTHVVIPDPAG